MYRSSLFGGLILAVAGIACLFLTGCGGCSKSNPQPAVSAGGVRQASTEVHTDANGHSVEQTNIIERLKRDNEPGAIKHLYVISTYSGQTLIYSPVRGKVTSSTKRLTPSSMATAYHSGTGWNESGLAFNVSGEKHYTGEVIQDDGSYGSSGEYLYWFTPDGRYHQHYLSGGQIVHIADQPLNVKAVIITIGSK